MRCTTAKKWISEYLDGDLDTQKTVELKEHLSGCAGCKELLGDLQQLVQSAQELPGPPERDVPWGKIQARLEGRQLVSTPGYAKPQAAALPKWGFALGTAMILLVAGAITLGPRFLFQEKGISELEKQQFTLAKLAEAEEHYQAAIKALSEAVEAQNGNLDPVMAEVFQTNLEIINTSIMACKQAVLSDPEDMDSRRYLLAAYKQKANLLNKLMSINESSPAKGKAESTL
jgi:tetratricopeptide (TPR) repeat protein